MIRTIFEALSRWNPPVGSTLGVRVGVDPLDRSHAVEIAVGLSDGRTISAVHEIGYASLAQSTLQSLRIAFTEAVVAAWRAADGTRVEAEPELTAPAPRSPEPLSKPPSRPDRKQPVRS